MCCGRWRWKPRPARPRASKARRIWRPAAAWTKPLAARKPVLRWKPEPLQEAAE